MNPNVYLIEAYRSGADFERNKREQQRQASRASQPKRKDSRKRK